MPRVEPKKPQPVLKLKKNDPFDIQIKQLSKEVNLSPIEVEKLRKMNKNPGDWQGFKFTKEFVEQWKRKERQKQYYKRRIATDFKPKVDDSKSFEIELRKEALLKSSKQQVMNRVKLNDIVVGNASLPLYFSTRESTDI